MNPLKQLFNLGAIIPDGAVESAAFIDIIKQVRYHQTGPTKNAKRLDDV